MFPLQNNRVFVKYSDSDTHRTGAALRRFISASEADLTSHAGLGLIGMALNERTNLAAYTDGISALRSDAVRHASILTCHVWRTDKGEDGYAPMAGYLGQGGYCLELQLRPGSRHCQEAPQSFSSACWAVRAD